MTGISQTQEKIQERFLEWKGFFEERGNDPALAKNQLGSENAKRTLKMQCFGDLSKSSIYSTVQVKM